MIYGSLCSGITLIAAPLGAGDGSRGWRNDLDQGAFVPEIVGQAMSSKWSKGSSGPAGDEVQNLVATVAFNSREDPEVTGDRSGPLGASSPQAQAIAFSCKDHGADASEIAPTLRAMGHDGSHANAGGQLAVAFESRFARNGRGAPSDIVPPLKAQSGESGKGDAAPLVAFAIQGAATRENPASGPDGIGVRQDGAAYTVEARQEVQAVASGFAVRRLTPLECERLQGFPDNYSAVPYRGKLAADGPRYKALGNSMAVNCMAWIGERIAAVSALKS